MSLRRRPARPWLFAAWMLASSCSVPEAQLIEPETGGAPASGGVGGTGAQPGNLGGSDDGGADAGGGTGGSVPESGCPEDPFQIATGLGTLPGTTRRVAVSTDVVYFASRGIYSWFPGATAPGTCTTETFAQGASTLAVSDTHLFFSTPTALLRATLPGCGSPTKLADLESAGPARDLVVDGTTVFYIDGNGTSDAKLKRCTGVCGAPETLAEGLEAPEGLAVDEDHVYFSVPTAGRIARVDKATLEIEDYASGLASPGALAVDSNYVYFAAFELAGKVFRCEKSPAPCSTPVELTPAEPPEPVALPSSLALLAERVVWTNSGGDSVASCPLSGCVAGGPSVIARGTRPLGLTGFADCAVWYDEGEEGSVFAVKLRR